MKRLDPRIVETLVKPQRNFVLDTLRASHSMRMRDQFEALSDLFGGGWDDFDLVIDHYATGVFAHLERAKGHQDYLQGLQERISRNSFSTHFPLQRLSDYVNHFSKVVTTADVLSSTYKDAVGAYIPEIVDRYSIKHPHDLQVAPNALLDLHARSLPENTFLRFNRASWNVFSEVLRMDLLYMASSYDSATDAFFIHEFFKGNKLIDDTVDALDCLQDFHMGQSYCDLAETYSWSSEK